MDKLKMNISNHLLHSTSFWWCIQWSQNDIHLQGWFIYLCQLKRLQNSFISKSGQDQL